MKGIWIDIRQIEKGFTVSFFSEDGPVEKDKTIHVKDWAAVLMALTLWGRNE